MPRSWIVGQRVYCVHPEICSCGMACRMASRTVRPGSAVSARPWMIKLPVVVWDNGLPPGSLVRSYARDVWQLSASRDTAARRGSERQCMKSPPGEPSPTFQYAPRGGAVKHPGCVRRVRERSFIPSSLFEKDEARLVILSAEGAKDLLLGAHHKSRSFATRACRALRSG